jgi:hypothetical protein
MAFDHDTNINQHKATKGYSFICQDFELSKILKMKGNCKI